METKALKETWRNTIAENKFGRLLVAGLVLSNLIAVSFIMSRDQIVVIPPPNWTSELEISRDSANAEFLKSYGLFISTFLGNITPSNVEFVKSNVGRYFDPDVYAMIRDGIEAQAVAIRTEGLSISFTPRQVDYEQATRKVFVTGFTRTEGRGGQSDNVQRTYEFVFEIFNYTPQVVSFNIYRGPPMTLDKLPKGATP